MIRSVALVPVFGGSASRLMRCVGLAIAAGVLLAILGPFGSYLNGGPLELAGYWIGSLLLGVMLYGGAYGIVSAATPQGSATWWPALIGATLLASLPESFATRAMAFWLWPHLAQLGLTLPLWFAQTATLGLIAMAAASFFLRRSASTSPDHRVSSPSALAIAAPLGADVLALQMEDHYVRVHRASGSELILMPMARAIQNVEAEGLRTHRSWWVASRAVARVEGNARSMRLLLSNGLMAPVARSAVTRLKTAGWIGNVRGEAAALTDRPPPVRAPISE